jgi:probable FeS assembly SUF system protein SufT
MSDDEKNSSSSPAASAGPGEEPRGGDGAKASEPDLDQRIWNALRECYDPEIPVNIVDLGLIYEVSIDDALPEEANVFVRMTLTAPGCGMGPYIAADVRRRVQQVRGVRNVMVDLVFDPPWNPGMMSEAARLQLNMF